MIAGARSNPTWLGLCTGDTPVACLWHVWLSMPCYFYVMYLEYTWHVVGVYFQCISCCMIVGLFVVGGDSCWVHTNVLTGLVFVARYWRGFIFYLSKDMEQQRARISSPTRCLWSGAAPSRCLSRLPLPVKLCHEPCLAWYFSCLDGLVNHL